eukprot:TRINITY_DN93599_c0_g1_i1.p2 TRINITY_DN93599_c0_g1~~TRINITY_DN93599_c0_g1_i1.p2  ORF type:complete len:141 (+),score=47.92 TRINITY_DN93599_c0_g1_i1:89-511(+)
MSQMSMGKRTMVGSPPDKGSFPIDHFNECTNIKTDYLKCLKENNSDNLSCRYLSKKYLQCRMDNNLMREEPMERLGFLTEETEAKAPRKKESKKKEDSGWVVGVDGGHGVQPARRDAWKRGNLIDSEVLMKRVFGISADK